MKRAAEHSTEKPGEYYRACNQEILACLPDGARRFLDVGCAAGALGRAIREIRPHAVVHGIERVAAAREEAAHHLGRVFDADLDQELPPLDPPYDCVICGDVLEHLVDPWNVLRRLVAQLAPGGFVVASIPNLRHYKVLRDVVLRGRFSYRESGVLDSTHLRFFTRREMERLFEGAGLEVIARRPHFSGGNAALRALDRLSCGRLEEFRALQYVIVGRRR